MMLNALGLATVRWLAVGLVLVAAGAVQAQDGVSDGSILPLPPPPFKGVITETFEGSTQDFPQPVTPPGGLRTLS